MHREILDFFERIKETFAGLFTGVKVLEAGSLDVNGSPRKYFSEDCEYIGVDAKNGRGVDWWGIFHEYSEKPAGYFDVCLTTEMLEHDPYWRISLLHMVEMIREGGSLIISCAGPGRGPHGIKYWVNPKTGNVAPEYHPWGPELDYYWNIKPELLLWELFSITSFREVYYWSYRNGQDLCLVAKGKYRQQTNYYNRGQVALLRKYDKTKI